MANEEKHHNEYSGFWLSKKQRKLHKATDQIRECKEELRKIYKKLKGVEE